MEIRRSQATRWVRYAVAVGLVSVAERIRCDDHDLESSADVFAVNAFCYGYYAKRMESPMLTCLSRKY